MRRGEVWRVSGLAGQRTMLVVGNDAIVDLYAGVQCVEIDTTRTARETLVTVHLDHPVAGTALVAGAGPVLKKRFEDRLGEVDADTMERVVIALRAVYDLP
jgi:mRNA-degrading endonuclease toxin of MazEF toxin-antitoxin module